MKNVQINFDHHKISLEKILQHGNDFIVVKKELWIKILQTGLDVLCDTYGCDDYFSIIFWYTFHFESKRKREGKGLVKALFVCWFLY